MNILTLTPEQEREIRHRESVEYLKEISGIKFRATLINRFGTGIIPIMDELQSFIAGKVEDMEFIWAIPMEDFFGED